MNTVAKNPIWGAIFCLWAVCGLGTRESQAQNSKSDLGLACRSDSDCMEGLLCIEVNAQTRLSVCLLACPQNQCLTGETCTLHASGKKVCMCDTQKPCRTGFPCLNGFCPGSTYCHGQLLPCPTSTFLCFQPIQGNFWGVCIVPCSSDQDCPPPGTRCLSYQGKSACYCRQHSDCSSGYVCVDFHCHQPCTSNAQCKKTEYCTGLICEPRPPDLLEPEQELPPSDTSTSHETNPEQEPSPTETPQDPSFMESMTDTLHLDASFSDSFSPDTSHFSETDTFKPDTSDSLNNPEQQGFDSPQTDPGSFETTHDQAIPESGSSSGCRCSGHEPPSFLPWLWLLVVCFLLVKTQATHHET